MGGQGDGLPPVGEEDGEGVRRLHRAGRRKREAYKKACGGQNFPPPIFVEKKDLNNTDIYIYTIKL